MELRQLRYFVAIVDHGSLSRAALALHIAQPALTQQIRQLEDELGTQLLHRSAQGVQRTDAGQVFYEHAQAILKQVQDAKSAVTQSALRPSGTVTLGLPQSSSSTLALPLLSKVREQYPEITLQLTEELTGNLIEQLKSGRINLAVLFDDGQLGQFNITKLVEEDMAFICKTGSQYAPTALKNKAVTLQQAAGLPLILPALQHGIRPRLEHHARTENLTLTHVIEISSVAILKSAILADLGATILPQAPLQDEIERGAMQAFLLIAPQISRSVVLCSSKTIPLTNAANAVAQLVQSVCDELCQSGRWLGATKIH